MKNIDSRLIYKRIKLAYGIKTDTKLAEFMGVKQSTIATNYSRNSVNWEDIISKCDNLSLDWLMTGFGEMFRNSSENIPNNLKSHTISQDNCDELIKYLLKRIKDLEEETDRLKKSNDDSNDVSDVDLGSSRKTGTM
jgi:hypothetical protein